MSFPWTSPRRHARRVPLDDRRALQDFSRSLALIVDPDALQRSVAARLEELFQADRLVILLAEAGKDRFVPSHAVGFAEGALADVTLAARGRLARWLLVNERCLSLAREPDAVEYLGEAERDLLGRLGIGVCAPLVSLNRLAGIVMLGSTSPEWRVSRSAEDLGLLLLMTAQAAIALENALLSREQRDRLQRLHRAERLAAAGQLAAGIAHDVRNPLTAIRSTVQYIAQDFAQGTPKRALVDELLHEVDRIDRTVDGLLSLTRPKPFLPQEVDAVDALRQSLLLLQAQAERQGVRIVAPPAGWPPGIVMGDATELRHLFVNLLMNALQAMPEGGTIGVGVDTRQSHLSATGAWLEIAVADSGQGIAKDQLDRVFDPFFTTKRDGTGLGLAICHGIVQRHEGEVDVASELGKGTTITVRFPARASSSGEPARTGGS